MSKSLTTNFFFQSLILTLKTASTVLRSPTNILQPLSIQFDKFVAAEEVLNQLREIETNFMFYMKQFC